MKKATVSAASCDGSPMCAVKRVCPVKAVSQKHGILGGTAEIDSAKCVGCGKCVVVCPHHAVRLV